MEILFSIVCAFLLYSVNGEVIDEKEIFEKLSTDLLTLKEFIATSKAEFDKITNNTGVFQGIKRFRLTDRGYSHESKLHHSSLKSLFNITLYAVNNQNYEQEITICDNEERKFLHIGSITWCISPVLVYDSWNYRTRSFGDRRYDIKSTEIENKTNYTTSNSVTYETLTGVFGTLIKPFKVNVDALSKLKVTTHIYSYDVTRLYLVFGAVLQIKSEDFETSEEQSDDTVKAAALEFFRSEYWKNLKKANDNERQPTIEVNLSDDIILRDFPLVVKSRALHHETDIGKNEPL